MGDDDFVRVFGEVEAMLRDARRDRVGEALTARIAETGKDEAAMALVVEGLKHLVEVLRRLHVTAEEPSPVGTSKQGWGDR